MPPQDVNVHRHHGELKHWQPNLLQVGSAIEFLGKMILISAGVLALGLVVAAAILTL